jgi:hypothetical protein
MTESEFFGNALVGDVERYYKIPDKASFFAYLNTNFTEIVERYARKIVAKPNVRLRSAR